MNDVWTQIIRTAPDLRDAGARARGGALAQWESERAPRSWRGLVLAFAGCIAMLLVVMNTRQPKAAPKQERLTMQMQLSDGTKVHWTFDERFKL